MDTSDEPMNVCDDVPDDDSLDQSNVQNTDEVAHSPVELSSIDITQKNDSFGHDSSLNTNEVVRHLVEHTISGETLPSTNDSLPLDTDDIVRNLVENETEGANLDSHDEVLDSMLESIENEDVDENPVLEGEGSILNVNDTNFSPDKPNGRVPVPLSDRICQLPLGRIKSIVKADPEVNVIGGEVAFLISKSCELFLQWLGKTVHAYTVQKKKKTIQKRDLDLAISEHPALEFLDGALD